MGWRTVLITKSAKIDLKLGYLEIRNCEGIDKIHLSEINTLVVENTASSITTALLNELIKEKINVIFCDEKRNPSSQLISLYGSHDTALKIRKQICWKEKTKKIVWTYIVAQKIKKQSENMKYFNIKKYELLEKYIEEIELNDETNREGHAAKVYFNEMFGKNFSREDENPINAMLNYGYSIILSIVNREIVASGYLTQLGIFHDNMFNHFNLGSDLMEPFRVIIDRLVKEYNPNQFEKNEKIEILKLLESEIVIDGKKQNLLNGIKIYVKSVLNAIENENPSMIKEYEI